MKSHPDMADPDNTDERYTTRQTTRCGCGSEVLVGDTASGESFITHNMPMCRAYETMGAAEYLSYLVKLGRN